MLYTPFCMKAFMKHAARKTECFSAYAISRKQSKPNRKNYGTLLNIHKQNCMRNLEHFRQSSLLMKIPVLNSKQADCL